MIRFHAFVLLADMLLSLAAVRAPVPPPAKLSKELIVGTWNYDWGNWHEGIICFDADGSYSAQHEPGGANAYAGTWKLEGNTVTITEYGYHYATGERYSGPIDYCFDFTGSSYPNLSGKSNGTTKVALSNPKR